MYVFIYNGVICAGYDPRSPGGKPALAAAEGGNALLSFQLKTLWFGRQYSDRGS